MLNQAQLRNDMSWKLRIFLDVRHGPLKCGTQRFYRTFSTPDGKFKIEAKYLSWSGKTATLKKRNGDEIRVPADRLCDDDIAYIENVKKARRLKQKQE